MDVLDAPLYPPATAFELPTAISFRPRLSDLSLAELMEFTEAWAIVLKRFPVVEEITNMPLGKKALPFISLYELNQAKPFAKPEELAALDAELQGLPSFVVVAP